MDLVVEFAGELEGVPRKLADVQALTDAFAKAVKKLKVKGAEMILPGAQFKFNLDFRPSVQEMAEKRKQPRKQPRRQPSVKESSHR